MGEEESCNNILSKELDTLIDTFISSYILDITHISDDGNQKKIYQRTKIADLMRSVPGLCLYIRGSEKQDSEGKV